MKLLRLVTVITALFTTISLSASHVAGGNITYKHIGGDTIELELNVIADCAGITLDFDSLIMYGVSSCGDSIQFYVHKDTTPITRFGQTYHVNQNRAFEMAQICPSVQSTCQGGSYPGYERHIYKTRVVLTQCAEWNFYHNLLCCRNTNVNLTSTTSSVAAKLNSQHVSHNNGPELAEFKVPTICAGKPSTLSFAAHDADGDQLRYRFVCGYSSYPMANMFSGTYTCTSPIPGIQMDSTNGLVNVVGLVSGNFVFVVEVADLDSNGVVKSTMIYDIQVTVVNCTNNPPAFTSNIANYGGSATQVDTITIDINPGENFAFDVFAMDPDTVDSLSAFTDYDDLFPGGFSTITAVGDSVHTRIVHNGMNLVKGNYHFTITVSDNACPLILAAAKSFHLNVSKTNVSMVEHAQGFMFKAYPNPAEDILNLEFDSRPREVKLSSIDGKVLMLEHNLDEKTGLDISQIPAGIYFLEANALDGQKVIRKVVKQ